MTSAGAVVGSRQRKGGWERGKVKLDSWATVGGPGDLVVEVAHCMTEWQFTSHV